MNPLRQQALRKYILLMLGMGVHLASLWAKAPSLAYAYPGQLQRGAVTQIILGGQGLREAKSIHSSLPEVEVKIIRYECYLDKKDLRNLENRLISLKANLESETDPAKKIELSKNLERQQDLYDHRYQVPDDDMLKIHLKRIEPKRQPNDQMSDRLILEFSCPEGLASDKLEIRVETVEGLSEPHRMSIGALPPLLEKEPNDIPKESMLLAQLPVQLQGQIMPGDVDHFKIQMQAQQQLTFSVEARSLVPYLADAVPGWFQLLMSLCDEQGHELATAEDSRLYPDPILTYLSPKDQTVILKVRDAIYRGREDFVYAISISDQAYVSGLSPLGARAGEKVTLKLFGENLAQSSIELDLKELSPGRLDIRPWLPPSLKSSPRPIPFEVLDWKTYNRHELQSSSAKLNTNIKSKGRRRASSTPQPQRENIGLKIPQWPCVIDGALLQKGQWERYEFEGQASEAVFIEIMARRLGSPLDAELRLIDPKGLQIALSDDQEDPLQGLMTHHADPSILTTLPISGLYTILLRDLNGLGSERNTYRLKLSRPQPDCEVMVSPSRLSVYPGGHTPFTIHLQRHHGFNGEVRIFMKGAPAGCSLSGNIIRGSTAKIPLCFYSPYKPSFKPQTLELFAEFSLDGQSWQQRKVLPVEDEMQAFFYRHLVQSQQWYVYQDRRSHPFLKYLTSSDRVECPEGENFEIKVQLPKSKNSLHKAFLEPFEFSLSESSSFLQITHQTVDLSNGVATLKLKAKSNSLGSLGNFILEAKNISQPTKPKLIASLLALRWDVVMPTTGKK